MKKKRRLSMLTLTLIAAVLLILILSKYRHLFYSSDYMFQEQMEELRNESQAGTDAMMDRINAENRLLKTAATLIAGNQPDLAGKMLDSAILADSSKYIYKTYKGMVYAAKGDDSMAIVYYNKSMWKYDFPLALYHRAQSLIRLNHFDSAVADLKKAADDNYDYGVHIAKAYEENKMIDSAIIYYKKYIARYPEQTAIALHLDSLMDRKR